jgi:hypothetical protein
MGTQGLSGRAAFGGRGDDRAPWRRISMLAISLAILPLAAGCSGSSVPSFGSSNPQAAAVPPPPNAAVAPAGQQAYAPPPAQPGAQPTTYATAAPPPAQAPSSDGATVGSFKSTYVSFLRAFRDPDPEPSGYDARASVYPQQSLADTFKGSADANQRPDPSGAGYPQQSLIRSPGTANPPQQNAYVPHPPGTYVPSGQPYTPPQGQPAYAPPADQQNYAAPPAQPNAPRSGQQSSAASSAKQAKAARASPQQSAAAPPPAPPAYAAAAPAPAAPPAQQDYSDSMPYPKQSLADVFRGSTEPQTQTVPRPPSTYTASGQPYTPQGQAANGAPAGGAAAAAPASQDPPNSLPYPKQSLFEVFSNK